MATKGTQVIEIKPLKLETVLIRVDGDTELITHPWSIKAKREMLDKHMGKPATKKENKDPEADYQSSIYHLTDGSCGFPAAGFKAAIVGACRLFDGFPMTQAKIAIRVNGDLVKINAEPHMREDMVRIGQGKPDIRFRAGFFPWWAEISITYNASLLNLEMLTNLVNAAGFGGIGEWRPSSPMSATGTHGCFHVTDVKVQGA